MWNNGRAICIGGVQIWPEPVTDVIVRRNLIFDNTTASGGKGASMLVESRGSWPPIASCRSAASSTVRAIGPAWSRLEENAISP